MIKKAKVRRETQTFVVEGIRMFREVPKERLVQTYVSENFLEKQENHEVLKGIHYEVMTDKVFAAVSDTQTPQGILCVVRQKEYTLEDIAQEYRNVMLMDYKQQFGKKSVAESMETEEEKFTQYAGGLIQTIYDCYEKLTDALSQTAMKELYDEIEMPLVYALYDMEKAGIAVEKDALAEYGSRLTGRIDELEKNIYELAGESFNINSPKQLGVILFEKLGLPFAKKTKTGYSTSADILEKLRTYDPIVGQILEYRQLTKLKSTYADGLAGYIRPDDQRIHGKFNQTITATGRISSTEPNLQNIPVRMELGRLIRKVFVPKEDCIFVNADYSQIELRVLAHMAGDEHLIQAYKEAQDIHRMTASQVFHTPFDEVTPAQRSNAKAVNFGIVYGISAFSLSQDIGVTVGEAKAYMEAYFKTFPGVRRYMTEVVEQAKQRGYVETLLHRRRNLPELTSSNHNMRAFGERVALNMPIQGAAADVMKLAMVAVWKRLRAEKLQARLVLQVHDELIVECPEAEAETVARLLQQEMEGVVKLSVPLTADAHWGRNWLEAKG